MATQVVHQTKYDWSAAWLIFLAGATAEEVSEMCHIPYSHVIQHSAAHYWAKRRTHAKATAFKSVNNSLAERIQVHRVKHQNHVMDMLEKTQEHIAGLEIATCKQDREAGQPTVGHLLSLVDQHDQIARRTLKLDEDITSNPMEAGFAMLVAMSKPTLQLNASNEEHEVHPFVNEAPEKVEKVVGTNGTGEAEKEAEISDSAMMVLPDDSEATTGNNRPIIGHILGRTESEMAPKTYPPSEEIVEPGPEAIKPMPTTLVFKTPFVNEGNEGGICDMCMKTHAKLRILEPEGFASCDECWEKAK